MGAAAAALESDASVSDSDAPVSDVPESDASVSDGSVSDVSVSDARMPGARASGARASGARVSDASGGAVVELDVTPIDGEGWRVSISHADRGNPFALLGFITAVKSPAGERFQVCVIGRPGAEIERDTLAEAIEVLRPEPGEVEAILEGHRH